MTIGGYDAVYVITLTMITFGALTFSVLTVHYWRPSTARRDPVFAAYTLVCAAAFMINVLLRIKPLWETPLTAALDLVTGFVPPLLLHLVSRGRVPRLRIAFYAISSAAALAVMLDDVSVIAVPFRDQIPAILLAMSGVLGLVFRERSVNDRDDTRLRVWYSLLLGLTTVVAVGGVFVRSVITVLAPDYLLLAFFCLTLYYRERLIFFDLLIKRGTFFFVALVSLALLPWPDLVPDRLTLILVLASFWLLAPWIDATLERLVDRLFLRRRYSSVEAERVVINELQLATTEDDLRLRAERSISDVFQSAAEVRFRLNSEHRDARGLVAKCITLRPRTSGIPYMTEDRRLLDSLDRTLGVMLENVRFREQQQKQQEREQQLRLLASRAELKALRAQINPHFLFNALNAIAGLIPSHPDLADQAVEQLAQVFRYTLRKSDNEWARLDEEAEFAAAYLSLEKTRFRERLHIEFVMDPNASAFSVPAMCVQPLIENAIRHGTSAVEGRGVVGLRIRVNGSMASIEVSDNGPGFPSGFSLASSAGHGLRNVAERLKGYYGDSARLSWECDSISTRVLLQIPRELEEMR